MLRRGDSGDAYGDDGSPQTVGRGAPRRPATVAVEHSGCAMYRLDDSLLDRAGRQPRQDAPAPGEFGAVV